MTNLTALWIDHRIGDALSRAFDKISDYQRDGYCTKQDVTEILSRAWGDAVADLWREYIQDGEE